MNRKFNIVRSQVVRTSGGSLEFCSSSVLTPTSIVDSGRTSVWLTAVREEEDVPGSVIEGDVRTLKKGGKEIYPDEKRPFLLTTSGAPDVPEVP